MRIYTKTGDTGETRLLFGGRVSKSDPRCEAYGTVDEAVSALGLARSLCKEPWVKEVILRVQRDLFTVGAELATDPAQYAQFTDNFRAVSSQSVEQLEQEIDKIDAEIKLPPSFIVPGASPGSSALDMARTILRRAERRIVEIQARGLVANPEVLRYVNRLSDLLFMLARYEDRALPYELTTGKKS
ncbi:MAG: cob(I)yrinic acid a,c-diamide adenosyltransferase [SAR202 cluster bacterium]|nr:cob(I)yrinic acid a,c-diamide adenosyltransferase [SAR202 cluster bacterium]